MKRIVIVTILIVTLCVTAIPVSAKEAVRIVVPKTEWVKQKDALQKTARKQQRIYEKAKAEYQLQKKKLQKIEIMYEKRSDIISEFAQRTTSENIFFDFFAMLIEGSLPMELENQKNKVNQCAKKIKTAAKRRKTALKKMKEINTCDYVFDASDATVPSHVDEKNMKRILSGTLLEQYADVYVDIEKDYGVNAIVICAISALESGWGTSRRAIEDHNYTGFGVYSPDAQGKNASSGEENLRMTAAHLAKEYLTEDGTYYNGKSIEDINKKYCVGDTWGPKVIDIGCRLMAKLGNNEYSIQ